MMLVGEHLRRHAGRLPADALSDEMPINDSGRILNRELRARPGR